MKYNTNEEKLKLPEYGRLIQKMVEHACTIQDRKERQEYAQRIVRIMAQLNPQLKNIPNFTHKLWDHLAYMANYELEIDYPVEICKREEGSRPQKLPYPQGSIRYRHYGRLIENAIKKLSEEPDDEQRERRLLLVANRMKRNLAAWKGGSATDNKVARDLETYSDGKLSL